MIYYFLLKDNDSLASRVAVEIGADLAILMSDVDGIFDKPPSQDNSRVIHTFIPSDLSKIEFGAKSNVGTGGNYYYEITNFLLSFFVFFSRGLSIRYHLRIF